MCSHKKWTEDCWECDHRFKTVKNYGHSREVVFPKRKSKNGFYLGIEIEVECSHSAEDVLDAIKGSVTDEWEFKSDISIGHGIEFESQPHTLIQWDRDPELLDWIGDLPRGCRSHDTRTCGLHIHVDRDAFSNEDICKINWFLNSHQEKFEKLGRRRWNDYCKPELSWTAWTRNRKLALNLSLNKTIEFRFPKGTLYRPTIKATIALVNAICEIAPTFDGFDLREDPEWCWEEFLKAIATGNRGKTSKHTYALKLKSLLNKKGFWTKELTRLHKEA